MDKQLINNSSMPHIQQLDGLRGIAILLVISNHYFSFIPFFSLGWSGVDLFFVLSGYLITCKLLYTLNKTHYFSNFYRNRVLRIIPVYFTVLIIFFTGIHFFSKQNTLPLLNIYTQHWKSFFLFTENWTYIFYGTPRAAHLLHFWSLAVEEQFYIFWAPLIFLLAGSRKKIQLFSIIIIITIIARTLIYYHLEDKGDFRFYYFNTFCRIDSLIIGAILAEIHFNKIKIPSVVFNFILFFSLLLIALSIIILKNADLINPFFGTVGYTIMAILYVSMVHSAIVAPDNIINRFYRNKFLMYCGKISYGLYIFHWLILLIFEERINKWGIINISTSYIYIKWFAKLICLGISFLLSSLSFKYFESYFLSFKK